MDRYQFLTLKIKVPSDWPVRAMHDQIMKVVQNAITHHLLNQRVIVTVGNVSALVTEDESGDGYFFRRTQEIPNAQTYGIYLILPSILMLKPNPEESDAEIPIPLLAANLKFHSLARKSFETRLGHSYMKIAVPNLKKIMQSQNVRGNEKFRYVLKSTYRVHESIQLSTILRQFTLKKDPVIFGAQVSEDEWDVVYYDQIPKPLWRRCDWKTKNKKPDDTHSNSMEMKFI